MSPRRPVWLWVLCGVLAVGCIEQPRDNDPTDAASADTGAADSGPADAGSDDVAELDAAGLDVDPTDSAEDTGPTIVELPPGCESDGDCAVLLEPGEVCRTATCDVATGLCSVAHVDDGTECGPGNSCLQGPPSCAAGVCVSTPVDCDDGDLCTDDSCSKLQGCQHKPNTLPCDDGDVCTKASKCTVGKCVGTAPVNCDDGNACTADGCEPGVGCVHAPTEDDCDAGAGSLCITASCAGGLCAQKFVVCEGGDNPCALAGCNPSTGTCQTPTGIALQDFKGLLCDDGDGCTEEDQCDGQGGCAGVTKACDDDNPCTTDSCNAADGTCQHVANADPCDDGKVCTAGDTCADGSCAPGPAPVCDDGNLCTTDACTEGVGCVSTPAPGPCSDGNACTDNDACDAGVCKGPDAVDCDDNEVCTTDACPSATGCTHTPLADGTACSVAAQDGSCTAGVCVPL